MREARDSLREEISQNLNENLAEHEVVTETVIYNDSLKIERITDRTRTLESGSKFQDSRVVVRTVRDTVYVEKRDSSLQVTAYGLQEDGPPTISSKLSAVSKIMKWIFWILIGLIGLIVTARGCLLRR